MEHGGFFQRFSTFRNLGKLLTWSNLKISDAFYLNFLAVMIGVVVALFVYCFKYVTVLLGDLVRGDGAGNQLALFAGHPWLILVVPAVGGLLVGLIFQFFAKDRKIRGVASVMASVARQGGRMSIRKSVLELTNSVISIASGLSVGMEGPIVVGGSSIGSNIASGFHLSATRRRVLVASGAAAGISAVFNAPIAGFFFAMELILGDFAKKAVAAIVLASVSSNIVTQALTHNASIYRLPEYGVIHWTEFIYYGILGAICGLAAFAFAEFLHRCDAFFPKLKIYPPLRPMIGGLIVGAIAFLFPEILGSGHHTITALINGHFQPGNAWIDHHSWLLLVGYLLFLAIAKIIATSVTLGSGAAGGKFAPSLFMGAAIGFAFGMVLNYTHLAPEEMAIGAYALVGMATIFGSIAQVPLAVILLIFEMTRDYYMILPIITAGIMSQVVFYSLRKEGVFTQRLAEAGIQFGRGKDLNILEAIPVGRVMHLGVETIRDTDNLQEIRKRFSETQHHGFPVVDSSGRLCGMFTTSDLTKHRGDSPEIKAINLCSRNVLKLEQDDDCHMAIALLEDHHIGRVPVVDSEGRPVGIITRTDIVGAYKLALMHHEQELEEAGG